MAKGRRKHNSRAGITIGWSGYRYGEEQATPITLAGRKPVPVLSDEARKHVIDRVLDTMRDWRQTPFENEGAVRSALRSALCLRGHGWMPSDIASADIVATVLRILGAERPSWEEGQLEYVEPRENCRTCGGLIPEELMVGKHHIGFCCEECARVFLTKRDFDTRSMENAAYQAAWGIIQRARQPKRMCAACHKPFRPTKQQGKYCSPECGSKAASLMPVMIRECAACGTQFAAKSPIAKFCSNACTLNYKRFSKGQHPKSITPIFLDYLFRKQGLRITGEVRIAA